MWEYQRKQFKVKNVLEISQILNECGKDNWEVIYYKEKETESRGNHLEIVVLLKRKKE